jgi:pimeloyl-ACP methyl ester carboxylesterase
MPLHFQRLITFQNWLNKPDGGEGWASYFISQGYACYIVDQTFRGRSAWFPGNGTLSTYSAEVLQQRFTAAKLYDLWPQSALHTQWNGTGAMGDPIFDTYYASTVEFLASSTYQESTVQAAGAALLDKIGTPVILLSHSQGGLMPWLIADVRPKLVHSIVSIEPTGPPFQDAIFSNGSTRPYGLTNIPLTYSPAVTSPADLVQHVLVSNSSLFSNCVIQADSPAPRKLVNLAKVPVLVMTTESSYHAPYDWCTVEFLKQAGVPAEHLQLANVGIHGNGHLVFMEKNSLQVAAVLRKWMEKK